MKILTCAACGDLVRLDLDERTCRCGKSGGYYTEDGLYAKYWGPSRMLGINNMEWEVSILYPPTQPYTQNFEWFVIGHWPGCHIAKIDEPELHNEYYTP